MSLGAHQDLQEELLPILSY